MGTATQMTGRLRIGPFDFSQHVHMLLPEIVDRRKSRARPNDGLARAFSDGRVPV